METILFCHFVSFNLVAKYICVTNSVRNAKTTVPHTIIKFHAKQPAMEQRQHWYAGIVELFIIPPATDADSW